MSICLSACLSIYLSIYLPIHFIDTTKHPQSQLYHPHQTPIRKHLPSIPNISWGVDIIREFDGSLAVAWIEEGGLMEQWNQDYPDRAVQPGDRFAEARDEMYEMGREWKG